jgi:hypothetical protein
MTLAFEFEALQRLADPRGALEAAEEWTASLGIVSEEAPDRAAAFSAREGLAPDFVSTVTGEAEGLVVLRRQYPTARHVLVGTTEVARRQARQLGWEFEDVEAAAEAAGWRLAAADDRWRSDS